MADFFAALKPKRSTVAGEIPLSSELVEGEIALNTADGTLFTRHTDGTIKTIVGAASEAIASGSVRTSTPQVAGTIGPGASAAFSVGQTGRTGQFLTATANGPCRVAFYSTSAARDNDDARLVANSSSAGVDGLLKQLEFTTAETQELVNSFYINTDPSGSAVVYCTIVNTDAASQDLTLDLVVVPIEGRSYYEAEGSSRQQAPTVTSSLLADTASENLTLTQTGRSGQFVSVTTSEAARVIFYSNQAARTADASRLRGEAVVSGNGVIMEVITTGAQTLEMTPAVMYHNTEPGAAGEVYMKVTNLSGGDASITVTVTIVPIEGRGHYLSELHELLDVDASSPTDGQALVYDSATQRWVEGDVISLATLKAEVAASGDFADFKTRIAAL